MKMVNVWNGKQRQVGVLDDGVIKALQIDPDEKIVASTDDVVRRWPDICQRLSFSGEEFRVQEYLPAIIEPSKIICVGRNYLKHFAKRSDPIPFPTFFAKFSNSLTGNHGLIIPPRGTMKLDYEGELAFIIGREGRNIPEEQALDYVFGYTVANDISARDFQRRTTQWLSGKMPDTFCPLGPCLVTQDEISDPGALTLQTRVNGELVQDGCTTDMLFSVPRVISELSILVTLKPGDVILTGTPEGTQGEQQEPKWLQPGDVVEVEIEGIGRLINKVAAPF